MSCWFQRTAAGRAAAQRLARSATFICDALEVDWLNAAIDGVTQVMTVTLKRMSVMNGLGNFRLVRATAHSTDAPVVADPKEQ